MFLMCNVNFNIFQPRTPVKMTDNYKNWNII